MKIPNLKKKMILHNITHLYIIGILMKRLGFSLSKSGYLWENMI